MVGVACTCSSDWWGLYLSSGYQHGGRVTVEGMSSGAGRGGSGLVLWDLNRGHGRVQKAGGPLTGSSD